MSKYQRNCYRASFFLVALGLGLKTSVFVTTLICVAGIACFFLAEMSE